MARAVSPGERPSRPYTEEINAFDQLSPGRIFLFAASAGKGPKTARVIDGYEDQAACEAHIGRHKCLRDKTASVDMATSLNPIEPIRLPSAALRHP